MKINKIRFRNINSLRGDHEIDFTADPLASAGLFAITGPTGSGKTTLLDVICLALFNRVPRISSAISKNLLIQTGSILTRNTQEAFAEVEYTCAQGTFQSRWEISTARTGNLRDYDMDVADVVSGKSLDVKKSEVPAANEKHIGLNYDQFVKSILLAQGDFARFLQASKSDRSQLLEKITGTGIYRQLGIKAFEMSKLHGQQLTKLREEQAIFKEQLLAPEDVRFEQENQKKLSTQLKEGRDTVQKLTKQLDQLREVIKLEQQLEGFRTQLAAQKTEKEAFDQKDGKRLEAHEALASLSKDLQQWADTQREHQRLAREGESLVSEEHLHHQKQGQMLKEVQDLVGRVVTEGELLSALATFYQKVVALQREIEKVGADYREQLALLRSLKSVGVDFDPKDLVSSIRKYDQVHSEAEYEWAHLKSQLKASEQDLVGDAIVQLDERLTQVVKAEGVAQWLAERAPELQRKQDELALIAQVVERLPKQIEEAQNGLLEVQKERELLALKLDHQRLRASLEEHRRHLKDGEPCPLCGALDHPFAVSIPESENELEMQLKVVESKVKEKNNRHTELGFTLQTKTKERETFQREVETLTGAIETRRNELEGLKKTLGKDQVEDWTKLRESMQAEKRNWEKYARVSHQLQMLEEAKTPLLQVQRLVAVGKDLRIQIKELYAGSDVQKDVQALRDRWNASQEGLKHMKTQLDQLKQAQGEVVNRLKALETRLLPSLEAKGYMDVPSALKVRLGDAEYQQLSKRRNTLEQEMLLLQQKIKDGGQLLEERKMSVGEETEEDLLAALQAKGRDVTLLEENLNETLRKLKNHNEHLTRIEHLEKQALEQEKTGKKWVLLNEYIGDATGKKFNDFAQDLTLTQLVVLSNRRLRHLNDRYQLDKALEGEDDSLMVIDAHMGSERRSVKTLSGGETFILSLSLALALSDLASRNVEINSLFIDEGFGTLDPEILDQTLDTLEKLQTEGGKTIGIISHVEALKERITTQIQLVRNGQGYSSLRVR